jgi:hypothetical protein
MNRDPVEPALMSVDRAGRIVIPRAFCEIVGWIAGSSPVKAWLLMGSPGRYRLLSAQEAEGEPDLALIRERIAGRLHSTNGTPLDVEDDASATLSLRFFAVQLSPQGPGWRLTLPNVIVKIMEIRLTGEVAVLMSNGHIEIWAVGTLKSALSAPLNQIAY